MEKKMMNELVNAAENVANFYFDKYDDWMPVEIWQQFFEDFFKMMTNDYNDLSAVNAIEDAVKEMMKAANTED